MGPLLVATAGVVAPAIGRNRAAAVAQTESSARFDEQIRAIADLIEFKRSHASELSRAEALLDELIAAEDPPIDFRARLRAKLEAGGAVVHEIDPIADDASGDDEASVGVETVAAPFSWSRFFVEATVAFDDVPSTLTVLESSGPTVVLESVDARRDPDRFGFVSLRCQLAQPVRRQTTEGE